VIFKARCAVTHYRTEYDEKVMVLLAMVDDGATVSVEI
jgi:hypothetical protein